MGSNLLKGNGEIKSVAAVGLQLSALKSAYRDQGIELETSARVRALMKGHSRTVVEMKEKGEIRQEEGKKPLSVEGYKLLCKKALEGGHTEQHLYLTAQWNLMVRTCSVSALHYDFISWCGDCIRIKVPRSKADQQGVKAFGKHVYSNPRTPSVCFMLSLGMCA
jgi:hypothetical protein